MHAGAGAMGLMKGYWITNSVWFPWSALYAATYGWTKSAAADWAASSRPWSTGARQCGLHGSQPLPIWAYPLCSGLSASVASAVTHPLDVVKTQVQVLSVGPNGSGVTAVSVAKRIWAQEGWRGFTRGMSARILTLAPGTAVSWMLYETTLQKLRGDYSQCLFGVCLSGPPRTLLFLKGMLCFRLIHSTLLKKAGTSLGSQYLVRVPIFSERGFYPRVNTLQGPRRCVRFGVVWTCTGRTRSQCAEEHSQRKTALLDKVGSWLSIGNEAPLFRLFTLRGVQLFDMYSNVIEGCWDCSLQTVSSDCDHRSDTTGQVEQTESSPTSFPHTLRAPVEILTTTPVGGEDEFFFPQSSHNIHIQRTEFPLLPQCCSLMLSKRQVAP